MTTTRSKTSVLRSNVSSNTTLFEYSYSETDTEQEVRKVTFTKHDFKLLQPAKFLNDTIIHFFMQYHFDNRIERDLRLRMHIFNSFFFSKVKQEHGKKNGDSPPSYKFASRWLKKVDIFDKDFLIIPICEKDHWLLVIVCYPANSPSKNIHSILDEDLFEPAVFVLNSCKGLEPPIKRALGHFLREQWLKERGSERSFVINNAKANGIRMLFPELPQQRNNYDCGVYILGYFYLFFNNPRRAYVKMFRKHSMKNWFIENNLDITRERRRMLSMVKNQHTMWNEAHPESVGVRKTPDLDSEEIDVILSTGDDSTHDCTEVHAKTVTIESSPELQTLTPRPESTRLRRRTRTEFKVDSTRKSTCTKLTRDVEVIN